MNMIMVSLDIYGQGSHKIYQNFLEWALKAEIIATVYYRIYLCYSTRASRLKFNLIQWNLAATSEEEYCASLEDSEQISLQTCPADIWLALYILF